MLSSPSFEPPTHRDTDTTTPFHPGQARDHTGVTTPRPTRTHTAHHPSVCPSPLACQYLHQGNP